MRISSLWRFDADGRATLVVDSVMEHEGRVALQSAASHVGRWFIRENALVVELPDHTDSPLQLSMTGAGELISTKRGTWRRHADC
jgi:hypothetical protein